MRFANRLCGCVLLPLACAFDAGPATRVAVTLEAGPAGRIDTDRGWAIYLEQARIFIHRIEFLPAGGEEGSGAAQAHLLAPPDGASPGTLRFAHSAGGGAAQEAGRKVGELVVERAIDLLHVGPQQLGEAVFARASESSSVAILVAPPDEPGAPSAGLHVRGTATRVGEAIPFEIVLRIDEKIEVEGTAIRADEASRIEIGVGFGGWFDGIEFHSLRGGRIADGSPEGDSIAERLRDGTFHVHTR